jgi:predicted DNA-binding antitoxin AbrB/MazE fold protein
MLEFDAVYEQGVIKPLSPLDLPENVQFRVVVASPLAPDDETAVARQKAALQLLWDEIDRLPPVQNDDGWSVRDHDALLYGER